ncbi:hypothetical protein AAC387_Pa09g2389 [Persea americana]
MPAAFIEYSRNSWSSTVSPDNQTLTLEKKAVDDFKAIDPTSLLSDSLLLRIFSLLPSSQYLPNSLVCKRWLALHGRLRRSLKLLDSSSFTSRFSDLTEIDLIAASVHSQSPRSSSYIFLTLPIHSDDSAARFVLDELFLPPDYIDIGLRTLSSGCPNLWKLTLIAETKAGLASIAAECPTLQELELHRCTNDVLSTIASFENLQILRVIAFVEGLYDDSSISDVGLTILAHDCRCLVKLELSGCEGSYEGISAIGPCCPMLEELTLCDHWMDGGWLAPLSFCGNLKTLRLEGCKKVDANPGQVEHLGLCLALKTLQLRRCQLQDKESLSTLFIVCATVREIIFQNFWGLDNDMFSIASICRSYYQIGFEADGSKGVDIVPFEEPFAGCKKSGSTVYSHFLATHKRKDESASSPHVDDVITAYEYDNSVAQGDLDLDAITKVFGRDSRGRVHGVGIVCQLRRKAAILSL